MPAPPPPPPPPHTTHYNTKEEEEDAMQQKRDEAVVIMASLSFRDLGGDHLRTARRESPKSMPPARRNDKDGDDDFEFVVAPRDTEKGNQPISADEIISDGRIRTVYPAFERDLPLADGSHDREQMCRLVVEEPRRRTSMDSTPSSSEVDELENVVPGTYCIWVPRAAGSPGGCKKRGSTGSLRRWRIRDLVTRRSHSDGNDKFAFLAAEEKGKSTTKDLPPQIPNRNGKAAETESEEEGKEAEDEKKGKMKKHSTWQSFLTNKQNVVGFLANMNGLRCINHPC